MFAGRWNGKRLLPAALALTVLMAGHRLMAQDVPPPPPDDQSQQQQIPQYGQPDQQGPPQQGDPNAQQGQYGPPPQQQGGPQGPQGQPLAPDQLNQMVAPIALYPDALVAQILAAATYPAQIVEADQWRQSQGSAPPDQIAAEANAHQQWDPSIKSLTAFPSVLSQLDRNMQWTTDLGNAYYNQPQDVMDAVQAMRRRAQAAGGLQDTPQQTVSMDNGAIAIAPVNPEVVYVPVYNPWGIYGAPLVAFPGYYYPPPPGLFVGVGFGFGLHFGLGISLHPWAPWGWGWHNWGVGWGGRTIVYNRTTYITRSTTVINRGFSRPGGPPMQLAGQHGSFVNRPGYAGYANRVAQGARPAGNFGGARPAYNGGNYARPQAGNFNQHPTTAPSGTYNRPAQGYTQGNNGYHPAPGAGTYHPTAPAQNYNRPAPQGNNAAPRGDFRPAPQHASEPHGGGGEHRR